LKIELESPEDTRQVLRALRTLTYQLGSSLGSHVDKWLDDVTLQLPPEIIEWWVLDDYPNYEIHKNGLVRNRHTKYILKQRREPNGSLIVSLRNGHKKSSLSVNKLLRGLPR
jgi:hypothetical protein